MQRTTSILFLLFVAFAALPTYAAERRIEVAFSPDGGVTRAIVELIGEAKKSVRVAAYSFTSKPIAKALVEASKRGIDVKVVLDKSQGTAKYSAATFLTHMNIPTRINARYAIMHNKFLIVDGVALETGSFNFTSAAEEKNAENILILRGFDEVTKAYSEQWQQLWEEGDD